MEAMTQAGVVAGDEEQVASEYLTFTLGSEEYAIDILKVQEMSETDEDHRRHRSARTRRAPEQRVAHRIQKSALRLRCSFAFEFAKTPRRISAPAKLARSSTA